MSVSGLRREAARGRPAIERIAGKDYVSLEIIERMRKLCRVENSRTAATWLMQVGVSMWEAAGFLGFQKAPA